VSRPSFQFYTKDWRSNSKLRRCSPAARGVWVDILCALHDSDEYGVARYSLKELASEVGASMAHVRELVDRGVLKGSDKVVDEPFVYVPRSGRKDGAPVTLIPVQPGPIWYSSRMVKDEYVSTNRGIGTRFGEAPKTPPDHSPKPPLGEGTGEGSGAHTRAGPSSSSSSATAVGKDSEAIASAAAAAPPDPKDAIFALGLPLLTQAGVSERNARSFLGFLRKGNRDEEVVDAIRRCAAERASAPVEFLQGCLRTATKGGETAWQRSQRERIAAFAPSVAAKPPGPAQPSAEVIDVTARRVG
jgi:hypothetical protein